ncbi:citrate/2-methylcitrate synthase [Paenisporosarcina sp. TG20]|uniref:citrate/2-methylcitrate synthase n=1 Tax=Paenisporosarcina sp. TG20 TaxID=1211706 RepID=UPI000300E567|nr:citrate/2-methylcitrate synthase [Paenisporosarcina sp. TG20]
MFQKGLKDIVAVQTKISSVDGEKGELRYRGELVDKVISNTTFEELSTFLWTGNKNSASTLFIEGRILPQHVYNLLQVLPINLQVMDVLKLAVSAYGTPSFLAKSKYEQSVIVTAACPVIIALYYRRQQGLGFLQSRENLGHTANFLYLLTGISPTPAQVEALETYLLLTMEHGLNASTFAARVTISTESDIPSAITSALGTMKGPLHGGAPSGVLDLLDDIKSPDRVRPVIEKRLAKGERIMGFGHRIYKTDDPRSILLREKCLALQGEDPWLDLATYAEKEIIQMLNERKPNRKLYTNVEFYAAAIMRAIDLDPALFTPTFSMARIVGWTAHAMEQAEDNTIFRPQSVYIGKPFVL